jgi:hypothetical protein
VTSTRIGADDDGALTRAAYPRSPCRSDGLSQVRDRSAGNSGQAAYFAAICALIVQRGVVAIVLRWFDLREALHVNPDL